jgi:hypothetical protein
MVGRVVGLFPQPSRDRRGTQAELHDGRTIGRKRGVEAEEADGGAVRQLLGCVANGHPLLAFHALHDEAPAEGERTDRGGPVPRREVQGDFQGISRAGWQHDLAPQDRQRRDFPADGTLGLARGPPLDRRRGDGPQADEFRGREESDDDQGKDERHGGACPLSILQKDPGARGGDERRIQPEPAAFPDGDARWARGRESRRGEAQRQEGVCEAEERFSQERGPGDEDAEGSAGELEQLDGGSGKEAEGQHRREQDHREAERREVRAKQHSSQEAACRAAGHHRERHQQQVQEVGGPKNEAPRPPRADRRPEGGDRRGDQAHQRSGREVRQEEAGRLDQVGEQELACTGAIPLGNRINPHDGRREGEEKGKAGHPVLAAREPDGASLTEIDQAREPVGRRPADQHEGTPPPAPGDPLDVEPRQAQDMNSGGGGRHCWQKGQEGHSRQGTFSPRCLSAHEGRKGKP